MQGSGGLASREAWSGHSMTSLEATWAAMVPLSPRSIWPPPFLPVLPACPCACCSVITKPGLGGCCSESRENPIWTAAETEERQEEDREDNSDTPDVFISGPKRVKSDLHMNFLFFRKKRVNRKLTVTL